MKKMFYMAIIISALASCSDNNEMPDAYGNFEATEIIISAEANGKIFGFDVGEGQKIEAGETLGYIDTMQLILKKEQLNATINAVSSKTKDIETQIDVLREQRANLTRELHRFEKLYKDSAATRKQLDDMQGQINVIDKNILATKKALADANRAILSEQKPLEKQILQIDDNISKSHISSSISGTILRKYAENSELASFGKPLLKVANLDNMTLRAYVSGSGLADVKYGDEVAVRIDQGKSGYKEFKGKVVWISDKAEFTPKIVQTKEERVNLVYAVKVSVPNDGSIKIGMPGEVIFKRK